MKITIIFFLIFFSFLMAIQKNIAVTDFKAIDVTKKQAIAISDLIESGLSGNNKYKLVNRKDLSKILKEQELQLSGMVEDADLVKLGKIAKLDLIVSGSLMKLGMNYFITVRITSIETAKIIKTVKSSPFKMYNVQDAVNKVIEKLTGKQIVESSDEDW